MPTRKKNGPTERSDLAQKAYRGIRQMLFYNEVIPGQKIKYQDLADRIGVSITPVIHALKWLEFKNIVRHEPNRGYFVNETSLQEVREIYDSRLLIEVSLVSAIVDSLTDAELKQLATVHEAYTAAVAAENYYGRLMTDMKFHLTLASLSGCRIQLKMLQELFDMLLLKYTRNLLLLGIMDTSRQEHRRIFDALAGRDAHGLKTALAAHLEHVREQVVQGFSKMEIGKKESMEDLFTFQ